MSPYDPITGRFASEDPAKDGINWFEYCSNSPTNYFDINGKKKASLTNIISFDVAFAMTAMSILSYALGDYVDATCGAVIASWAWVGVLLGLPVDSPLVQHILWDSGGVAGGLVPAVIMYFALCGASVRASIGTGGGIATTAIVALLVQGCASLVALHLIGEDIP